MLKLMFTIAKLWLESLNFFVVVYNPWWFPVEFLYCGFSKLRVRYATTVFFQTPYLVYHPSLEFGVADGFYDVVDGLTGDIFRQSSKINRLAKNCNQEHYQVFLSGVRCQIAVSYFLLLINSIVTVLCYHFFQFSLLKFWRNTITTTNQDGDAMVHIRPTTK